MTRHTRSSTTTTALALAIAATLVTAPAAYAASKRPALGGHAKASKRPVFAKPAQAYGANLAAPADASHDSFIISFQKGATPGAAALRNHLRTVGNSLGIQIAVDRDTATGAKLVRTSRALDRDGLKRLTRELMKSPMVRAVDPNGRMYRAMEPNDELFAQQWHYRGDGEGMNAVEAWDSVDGTGYIVAVLDTGLVEHEDLEGQFIAGYDFITDAFGYYNLGAGGVQQPSSSGRTDSRLVSFFARANYAFDGRFYVTGVMRRDGDGRRLVVDHQRRAGCGLFGPGRSDHRRRWSGR